MTWWSTLAAVVWPASIALLLVRHLGIEGWLSRVGLSIAFGLGVTSVTFFLSRLVFDSPALYVMLEIAAVALAVLLAFIRGRRLQRPDPPFRSSERERTVALALAVVPLAIILSATMWLVRRRAIQTPNGDWDAWAIWNLRAAFLAAANHWRDGFTPALAWSHPDYPLLLPASVARLWTLTDAGDVVAPLLVAFVVLLALICVVGGSLLQAGGVVAMACGIALLLVPEFVAWATSQTADVALGLFLVVAFTLLTQPDRRGLVILAGVAAGLVAWTKNEGLVAALAMPGVLALVTWLRHGSQAAMRSLALFLIGLLPVLAVLVVFRTMVAPAPDLVTGIAGAGMADKLTDFARHRAVALFMFDYTFRTWGWWPAVGPAWLAVAWIAIGLFRARHVGDAASIAGATLSVMLVADYVVYVLTPYDLTWHISSSWPRLLAQLWPSVIWLGLTCAFVNTRAARPIPRPVASLG